MPTTRAPPVSSGSSRGARLWTSAGPSPASNEPASRRREISRDVLAVRRAHRRRQKLVGLVRVQFQRKQVSPGLQPLGHGRRVLGQHGPSARSDDQDLIAGQLFALVRFE